ncbi:MAG TPA: LptA/OstA family protein [Stellaceae bacterium]|jgi:lipopolysaccharide export system protein LptA
MNRSAAAFLAALVLLTAAPAPHAQTQSNALDLAGDDNNNKPVNIEAENGIEWQQNNKVYIARGNAKATRGDDTVTADTLYAYYRNAPAQQANANSSQVRGTPASGQQSPFDNGSTQIYRLEAEGHVVFATPTQTAYGDHAVYDVDQALLVVTGKNLKIVTPQDVVTARDSLEWYDQKQIGVARGNAVATRQGPEHKSIRGDVLTTEVTKPQNQPSKISKVNAQGHVILVSEDQIARGNSGVYNLDTGIATLSGQVSLTRGENELRGQYAVVDTNTNVARLLAAPPSAQVTGPQPRVQGLLIPRQGQPGQTQPGPAQPAPAARP